jgi:hypothetical protein
LAKEEMESSVPNQGVPAVLRDMEAAEKQVSDHLVSAKKLKSRLMKARKDIAKAKPITRLTALVMDLKALPIVASPDVQHIVTGLERQLHSLAAAYGGSFGQALRHSGEAAGLHVRPLHEGFAVGPFSLTVDAPKEVGALSYAKVLVAKDLPLDPNAVIKAAQDLSSRLLQAPSIDSLRKQVEEAMRVAAVRQKKVPANNELRADLPSVYREMGFIRQGSSRSAKAASDYSLARFAVELKTLVQSDDNTASSRRFRLETAVLENTKDPRKSVFIPSDLAVGYGEGTYYQALLLVGAG